MKFKKLLLIFNMLLFFNLGLKAGETDKTSKSDPDTSNNFNGIDYYSGRMISGIGFGINQFFEEKIDGGQELESNPFIYYNLSSKIALEVSNRISMKRINPNDQIDYATNPINTTTTFRSQIKPLPGLQIFPYIELNNTEHVYNSHFWDDVNNRDEIRIQDYGFNGLYITKNGIIKSNPFLLKWIYYSDDYIPLLNQGQPMVKFSANYKHDLYKGRSEQFKNEIPGDENSLFDFHYKTNWQTFFAEVQITHGFSDKLYGGLTSQYYTFTSDLWNDYERTDNKANQKIETFSIEPRIYYFFSENIFNRFSARFQNYEEQSNYNATFRFDNRQENPVWEFQYGFQWLINTDNPSLGKVLANNQNIFGNRLSQGAVSLNIDFSHHSEIPTVKYSKIFETLFLHKFYNPELKIQSSKLNFSLKYGIIDFLEIGFTSKLLFEKSYKPDPGYLVSNWSHKKTWQNWFSIDFGNYIYSSRFSQKYGWYNLSPFDQYYTPTLQAGMFNGNIKFCHVTQSKADDYFGYVKNYFPVFIDINDKFINNRKWMLSSDFSIGLWGNLAFKHTGLYYFYSSKQRNYLDKDWDRELTLSWQPHHNLRFEIIHNSSRYVNNWESRFYYFINSIYRSTDYEFNIYNKTVNTWKVRLINLF